MGAGGHYPAGWGKDLSDGFVRLQILGVSEQRRNRRPEHQLPELVGAHAEVALTGGVDIGAELGVEKNADGGEHYCQAEREGQASFQRMGRRLVRRRIRSPPS